MTGFDIAMAGLLSFGQVIPSAQREIVKHSGLQVIHADGAVTLRLKETGREERAVEDGRVVTVKLQDEHYPVYVTRYVKTWNDCDAVETWYELRHDEPGPVKVLRADSFAARVDCRADVVKVLTLTGVWALEANVTEATVANGQIAQFRSLAGTRDAWESNAAMMVSFGGDVDEERGKVLGVALEWTGTTEKRVRRSWNGRETDVFVGIDMETGPYTLDPGVTFTTPRAILVWSEKGKGEVSRQYHRWARRHLMPHGDVLHPILLNTWEGSYFSFTEKTLTDMMDGVKEMGGEMLVLDDGWFGKGKYARDNKNRDKTGLGDWVVNPEKLPHGLAWLADEAAKRGLKFGLWVEPEMCNVASWLAEAHPDWILREKNRSLLLGRGGSQVVLDYTNPAVRENIFNQLDAIYAQVPTLAYVKWDSNQNIVNPGSTYLKPDRQPNLWYDYTIGLYDLLAKLQTKRPHIMVQACASGGGHMDFGFLRYADEFWASDNTDPFRRVFIQWGASQFYPASAMACHVTKRGSSMKYRFDVAMTGRMGFELHPKNLSKEDVEFAKAAVADYKRIRPIVQRGDLYRLVSPYGGRMSALMFASEAKDAAAVFALGLDKDVIVEETLHLRGLDPNAKYVVTEINKGAKLHAKLPKEPVTGRTLMEKGIAVRLSGKFDSASFEVARCEGALEARKRTAPPQVRVMTYNVRYSAGDRKSKDNNWKARRDDFACAVEREAPDVVGFQEVLPDQRKWLEERFPDYAFIGEGRNADRVNGESSPVAFRRDRFEAVKNGTFWLSETPDVPGSKSWGTAIQRICTYAVLKDKATGKTFSFANTHTDHKSEEAREKGMLLIIERMKDFGKGAPVVFVGDHNCLEYEKPAKSVSKLLTDAIYLAKAPEGSWRTFNFWSWHEKELSIAEALKKPKDKRSIPGDMSDMKRIDYIYVSPGTTVLDYRTVSTPRPGTKLYPSDHFPSVATLVFK